MKAATIFVVLCMFGIVSSVQAYCDTQSVDAAVLLDNGTAISVESCGCSLVNTGIPILTTNFEMTWRIDSFVWDNTDLDLLGTVIAKQDAEFTCTVLVECDQQAYVSGLLNPHIRHNTTVVEWCDSYVTRNAEKPSHSGTSVPTTFLASGETKEIAFPNTFEQEYGTVTFTVIFTDVTSGEVFTCSRQVNIETLEITIPDTMTAQA